VEDRGLFSATIYYFIKRTGNSSADTTFSDSDTAYTRVNDWQASRWRTNKLLLEKDIILSRTLADRKEPDILQTGVGHGQNDTKNEGQ